MWSILLNTYCPYYRITGEPIKGYALDDADKCIPYLMKRVRVSNEEMKR